MRKDMWIAPAVFAADQVTKALSVQIPPEGCVLIPGVLGLRYTRNTGMAFSLLSGHPWLLGVLGLVILAGAAWFLRGKKIPRLAFAALMSMAGGAAGNMVNRLVSGYVPDMIELLFIRFAVFNLADVALTVGCGLLIFYLLFWGEKESSSSR